MFTQRKGKWRLRVRMKEISDLEIVARVALELPPTSALSKYLRTKKEKLGHLLELV